MLRRALPPAFLLRVGFRSGAAIALWLAGYPATAHIVAVFAIMGLAGPIELAISSEIAERLTGKPHNADGALGGNTL